MSQKNYFGIAAIILSIGFSLSSFMQAKASYGPTVSLGSNPLQSWSKRVTQGGWSTLENFSSDFVITDVTLTGNNDCHFVLSDQNTSLSNNNFVSAFSYYNGPYFGTFQSGILVPSGTTLYVYINPSSICNYTISGYFSH